MGYTDFEIILSKPGFVFFFFLQVRKLRLREGKSLAQSGTVAW